MIEADYQLALLLQREFEVENKNKMNDNSDYSMAIQLQTQFEQEININNPRDNLVYDKSNVHSKNDIRSLADPSWELIDPTPNIHSLFVAFNQRFFWNKLLAVSVSWSKRMTSCAGVCSYNGAGGMCVVTLSEPLLKLRPRKDLVETLLHEMIHAYLFVTHNNRDRDGHGPEFHKHMYRINKEAGINITVYHNFHEEVRLYQQHWWRCNGPCQQRKPFFGIVRRASNRAPGPNDRWWNEHAQNCGGTFVKIREPEKKSKSQEIKKKNSNSDIRSFIQTGQITNKSNKQNENDKNVNNKSTINNIRGFDNFNSPKVATSGIVNHISNSNIVGFVNSKKSSSSNKTKSNSSSTIVINKKSATITKVTEQSNSTSTFQGTGHVLQPTARIENNDYSVVRNHWLTKFNSNKRSLNDDSVQSSSLLKKSKTNNIKIMEFDDDTMLENTAECPICENNIPLFDLNEHLDKCLDQNENNLASCIICDKKVPNSVLTRHQSKCYNNNFSAVSDENKSKCEICNTFIDKNQQKEHTQSCLNKVFNNSQTDSKISQAAFVECDVCNEMIDSNIIDKHINSCLHKMYDEIENRTGLASSNILVPCLVCTKKFQRSELNAHLDECMKDVFDDENEFDEMRSGQKDIKNNKQSGEQCEAIKKYNCPFCLEMYSEFDMSVHIDKCLVTDECVSNAKSLIIDSLTSDNF